MTVTANDVLPADRTADHLQQAIDRVRASRTDLGYGATRLAELAGIVMQEWATIEPALRHRAFVAWIIANGSGDKFRTWNDFGPAWTANQAEALHFARRVDADKLAAEDEDAWLILPVSIDPSAAAREEDIVGIMHRYRRGEISSADDAARAVLALSRGPKEGPSA
jgi:hypothetical protein